MGFIIPPDARNEDTMQIRQGFGTSIYRLQKKVRDRSSWTSVPDKIELSTPLVVSNQNLTTNETFFDLPKFTIDNAKTVIGIPFEYNDGTTTHVVEPNKIVGLAWNDYGKDYLSADPDANTNDEVVVIGGNFIADIPIEKFVTSAPDIHLTYSGSGNVNIPADFFRTASEGMEVFSYWDPDLDTYMFMAITTEPADRYPNTGIEYKIFDAAVIGKILKVDSSFVTVKFSI